MDGQPVLRPERRRVDDAATAAFGEELLFGRSLDVFRVSVVRLPEEDRLRCWMLVR